MNQDITACAALVERADPHRFRATMAAPVAARSVLFPIYAFNVEVARAPWVTQEPMIAEMRLQWWRDALEEIANGAEVRRHEVVTPLAQVLRADHAQALDALVAARRWDIYKDPFEDAAHFEDYLTQTAGTLLWVAADALGTADRAVVQDAGYALGVANWLRAIPALEAQQRVPLVDGRAEAIQFLATNALARLKNARNQRYKISVAASAAMFAVWEAAPILKQAMSEPRRVADGALGTSDARSHLTLMWRSSTGRW